MKRRLTYVILVILVTAALVYIEGRVDERNKAYPKISEEDREDYPDSEFDDTYLPRSTTSVVVEHVFFTLSYSEEHEQAEWVAYELKKDQLARNEFERPYFVQDRKVKSGSADWKNYKNSGYDRGHLCPAGDRRFTYDAYHETFLTSNISPQDHDFNAGIWNRLEQKVRYWAKKYDGVYVVTGGVLKDDLNTIGDERVSVPGEFYKIVVDASADPPKAIAFLMPNEASSESIFDYVVTIDRIEAETGIDFFPQLYDGTENYLESGFDLKAWGRR